jgi:serine/threonine protein kinase
MDLPFDKPKSFGPFELLKKVGRGVTATVYKARQKSTGRIVALKMGARLLSLKESNFARFKREFTIIRDLRHPNLVEALEFGEENRVPYLVLEFVEGQTLEQRLRDKGPMPLAEAIGVVLQVAEGLSILHQNQLLHRDIKPGNVLLTEQGQAKLGDFGLLKTLMTESGITGHRQALGTLEFGAPEQFEDAKNTDVRCDIYSLAATLYAVITGFFPFGSGSLRRMLQRKLKNQFVPLRTNLAWLPTELDDLVTQSLNANRTRRLATIEEFVACLTKIVNSPDFNAATLTLPSAPTNLGSLTSGKERRAAARVSVALSATYVPFHQPKRSSFRATILDVSSGGLCLQTNTSIPLNSLVEVIVAEYGASYIALVRWVKTVAENDFIVGCSFACTPRPQEINAITPTIH